MANQGITRDDLILVVGATGKQGGAVARRLLEHGWQIRCLVRDKGKAHDLAQKGAELFLGNLDDPSSLDNALQGCQGVFCVTNFWETGFDREIRQGKTLADIAKRKGIGHFVYSSVQSANRKTGIPHFESKWQVEEYIRGLGLPHTIVRPVFFMQNFLHPDFRKAIENGILAMEMKPHRSLQMVNVEHVGDFVRFAFEKKLLDEEIDLASDELTMPQVADAFSKLLNRVVKYVEISLEECERTRGKEWAMMMEWFNKVGYNVNIPQLKSKYGIPLSDFNAFLYKIWAPQKTKA